MWIRVRDLVNRRSGIQDKHPGSATLRDKRFYLILIPCNILFIVSFCSIGFKTAKLVYNIILDQNP